MSYISRISSLCKRFLSSFSFEYDPPNAKFICPSTLLSSIVDSSNQGKLLVINLTINNKKINVPLNLPEEDFIVFSAPYNSKEVFNICRSFPIDSLPFIGLFFCPSRNPSEAQLIDKIVDMSDLIRTGVHFRQFSRELYKRRDNFVAHESNRSIIADQDNQYNEVLKEAQRIEEEQKKKKEEEEKLKQNIDNKVKNALKRYNSMPAPPPKDDPTTLSIRFMIPNQQPKVREFKATDPVKLLYDFVSPEFAPNEPKIKYGFPARALSQTDMNMSLADLKFARKETVFVESDEEDEDEEN